MWGITQFSWVSLMCTGIILVIKLLFVLLLFPVIVLLQWSLSQEPRRGKRKLFFLPYTPNNSKGREEKTCIHVLMKNMLPVLPVNKGCYSHQTITL